jgi:putative MATE family efflux protein
MAASIPAATPLPVALAPRTRQLLEAPIASTLLRLTAPTAVVMVVQAGLNILEAYFVGTLGTEALAGISLTFPLVMLMQTTSAGGMGGGVASAIARALGAGRQRDADALVIHAGLIAVVMGAVFTVGMLIAGPAVYRAMGGTGGALDAALAYSNVIFAGALAFWLFNTLAAVIRGTGNMTLPASTVVAGAVLLIVVSPLLIFGWGPFPRLGIRGAAIALLAYYALGTLVFATYLLSGRGLVRLSLRGMRFRTRLFVEILRVGAPAAVNTMQANLTVILLTGLVGPFGTFALAGYGMGARLEYLQIPLVFALGSTLVTMVGTNVGAGRMARARRITWVGAAMAAALTEAIGLAAAFFPHAWLGLFSSEPELLAVGSTYLRIIGPTYGFFGLGLALYFASQGAGRLLWPLLAGFVRLVVAGTAGWLAVHWIGTLPALFGVMAFALVVFGTTLTAAIHFGVYRR